MRLSKEHLNLSREENKRESFIMHWRIKCFFTARRMFANWRIDFFYFSSIQRIQLFKFGM
jgi:hypothetical protein